MAVGGFAQMPHGPVQRHDRLAGTGRARNANWPRECPINNAALAWMEEYCPFVPGVVERRLKFRDVLDNAESAERIWMHKGTGAWQRRQRTVQNARRDVF